MSLSSTELIWQLLIAFAIGGTLAFLFWKQRQEVKKANITTKKVAADTNASAGTQLKLQAYERLILLADRIALPNLINRVNQPVETAREMQSMLVQNIKHEFEYNVTQQIYVTVESWEAVKNLKDQNLLIINQVASFLPPDANGQDLNRAILEMLVEQPNASLHNVVSEVLSFEAKKLM